MSDHSPVLADYTDSETETHQSKRGKKEPNNFQCNFESCFKAFNRKWKLDRHICSHTNERPFNCAEVGCDKSYQSLSHLQRHAKTAHLKLNRLPCTYPLCKSTFTCKTSLLKHCKNHGVPRIYQCSKCSVSFSKLTRLKKHEQLHAFKLNLLCPICQVNSSTQTALQRHMRIHQVLKCDILNCMFVCNARPEMRRHEKIEHPVVLICDFCKKSYSNKGLLRDHITTHFSREERGLFYCPQKGCLRAYFQKRNLRHHLKVFHNKLRKLRYSCVQSNCHKSYATQIELDKHVKRHHGREEVIPEKLIDGISNILPISDPSSHDVATEPAYTLEIVNRKL